MFTISHISIEGLTLFLERWKEKPNGEGCLVVAHVDGPAGYIERIGS